MQTVAACLGAANDAIHAVRDKFDEVMAMVEAREKSLEEIASRIKDFTNKAAEFLDNAENDLIEKVGKSAIKFMVFWTETLPELICS